MWPAKNPDLQALGIADDGDSMYGTALYYFPLPIPEALAA